MNESVEVINNVTFWSANEEKPYINSRAGNGGLYIRRILNELLAMTSSKAIYLFSTLKSIIVILRQLP